MWFSLDRSIQIRINYAVHSITNWLVSEKLKIEAINSCVLGTIYITQYTLTERHNKIEVIDINLS